MKNLHYFLLLAFALGFTACGDDDDGPAPENEEELITTVILSLTSGTDVYTYRFTDLDGDGGTAATITNATIPAQTTFTYAISFLNETETPAEDITEEVREEDEEHQVFYSFSGDGLSFTYGDQDADGNPIGLTGTATSGDAGTGTLNVVLRHEPEKSNAGVSDGDITNANGETDIDVNFDVTIQ